MNLYSIMGKQHLLTGQLGQQQPGTLSAAADVTQFKLGSIQKGTPITGRKIEPQDKLARYMPDTISEAAVANGASVEYDAGVVLDFVDLNATAIAFADWTVVTPHGDTLDLFGLCRIKGDPENLYTLPAGKYTFTNVSGGALNLQLMVHQVQADEI